MGARVHAEGQRGGDAVTADLGFIAFGDVAFDAHDVEPEGGAARDLRDGLVDVGGEAAGEVGAELGLDVEDLLLFGDLGFLIDDAAGGAASELDAGGAFEDFDLLVVESVAVVAPEVADAIEEDVVTGGEAADGEVVALGAEFAGGERDAGHVAERVAEGGGVLILEGKVGDGNDGLGCFEQGFGELLHGEAVGQRRDDVDGLAGLDADAGVGGVGEVEGEAGAGEELAERLFGVVGAVDSLALHAGERVDGADGGLRDSIVQADAGGGFKGMQRILERAGRDREGDFDAIGCGLAGTGLFRRRSLCARGMERARGGAGEGGESGDVQSP